MKPPILFLALLLCNGAFAQIFEAVPPLPNLLDASEGTFAFGDIDGDQDLDLIISGRGASFELLTTLYINDGAGNYEATTDSFFIGVDNSAIVLGDLDGDLDLDVVISGRANATSITQVYLNDGVGGFTAAANLAFDALAGAIALGDVDGDQDLDLVISGMGDNFLPSTKLFFNQSNGTFSEASFPPFSNAIFNAVAFVDIDNDQDLDILGAGGNTTLYRNDGQGNYEEVVSNPFTGAIAGAIAVGDVDGDQDMDVVFSGSSLVASASLYLNDGTGDFILANSVFLDNIFDAAVVLGDMDGDQDLDLIISGRKPICCRQTTFYLNDGTGNYASMISPELINVASGHMAFGDIDGDNDLDLLISGLSTSGDRRTKLYKNDGAGELATANNPPFIDVSNSAIAVGDLDGDQDQDIIITGRASNASAVTRLYRNDGTGQYVTETATPFPHIENGTADFLDVDGDNDLDFFITGLDPDDIPISKLFRNNGSGNFEEIVESAFEGVSASAVAHGDIDGDQDVDLIVVGENVEFFPTAILYTNDGSGSFLAAADTTLANIPIGDIAMADIDNDGDLDFCATGLNAAFDPVTKIYLNDGLGTFSEDVNTLLDSVALGTVTFEDLDSDQDVDLILTGTTGSPGDNITKIFLNDGQGSFTEIINGITESFVANATATGDVDKDGDIDIIISGLNGFFPITLLYLNDGQANFTALTEAPLIGASSGDVDLVDIDGDLDLDLLVTGAEEARLYLNVSTVSSLATTKNQSIEQLTIFPNPSAAGNLQLIYEAHSAGDAAINIYDSSGKLCARQNIALATGTQVLSVNTSQLRAGNYFLQFISASSSKVAKFTVK